MIQVKTYEEELRERLKDGRGPRRVETEKTFPGVESLFTGRKPTKVSAPKVASEVVPAKTPTMVGNYDINTDFMSEQMKAEAAGDYGKAKEMEYLRNQKIGTLGLDYANTDKYNYFDPYRGDLDRQREAIESRGPFSYDYREDDLYKTIRALKEKEAQKAYNDGYAQLSRQFDGDIPVNMINKLITTKGEITDQADSYIPQLRQMAYQMHQDEGDRMLQNYSLTRDAAAEDYARWSADRDFILSGMENKYARDRYDKEFEYNKGIDDRNFNYAKDVDERNFNYNADRDEVSDYWMQKQWDEDVRRWNKLHL